MKDSNFLGSLYNEDLYIISEKEVSVDKPEEETAIINELIVSDDKPDDKPKEGLKLPTEKVISEEKPHEDPELEVKGENRRDIVVLIDYPKANFLPGDLDEFFQKIMGAVSLTYKDIAMINLAQFNIKEIPLPHTKILTFGVSRIPGIEMDLKRYEILKENDLEILNADSLKDISENKDLKVQLWNSLKQLFPN